MAEELTPLEIVGKQHQRALAAFVNDDAFMELQGAFLDEAGANEKVDATGAAIGYGKMIQIRNIFKKMRELAKPKRPPAPKRRNGPDPDLDA